VSTVSNVNEHRPTSPTVAVLLLLAGLLPSAPSPKGAAPTWT
jgi:hypothetical protein